MAEVTGRTKPRHEGECFYCLAEDDGQQLISVNGESWAHEVCIYEGQLRRYTKEELVTMLAKIKVDRGNH